MIARIYQNRINLIKYKEFKKSKRNLIKSKWMTNNNFK